jgi:hypothetical protein
VKTRDVCRSSTSVQKSKISVRYRLLSDIQSRSVHLEKVIATDHPQQSWTSHFDPPPFGLFPSTVPFVLRPDFFTYCSLLLVFCVKSRIDHTLGIFAVSSLIYVNICHTLIGFQLHFHCFLLREHDWPSESRVVWSQFESSHLCSETSSLTSFLSSSTTF